MPNSPSPDTLPVSPDAPRPPDDTRTADELRAECERLSRALSRRRAYEEALASSSTVLLGGSGDEDALSEALLPFLEAAAVSRITVYENYVDEILGLCARQRGEVHAQNREALPVRTGSVNALAYHQLGLERWVELLPSGRAIQGAVPELDEEERDLFAARGARSVLLLPIWTEGRWYGFLCFEDGETERDFDAEDLLLLGMAAEMVGAFLKRVRGDRELRESEQRLRSLIQNMPVLVVAFDTRGEIIFWNRECERVSGYRAGEIVGDGSAMERLYPNENYRQIVRSRWSGREEPYRHLEWRLTCKDGGERTIAWSNISTQFPIPGWHSWAIGVDLTERARVEAMIIRAKQEWERTFDSVPEPIALLDQNLNLRRLNHALALRLARHPKELVGLPFPDLLIGETPYGPASPLQDGDQDAHHAEDGLEASTEANAKAAQAVTEMAANAFRDEAVSRELVIPRLGGHFLVTVSPYALREEGREGVILVAHDITRFKLLEEQLRQTQKMEALGTLAGGIAHDFNNILGVVMGYTEMLLDSDTSDSQARRLGEILAASTRGKDLVNQILTFTRQSHEELKPLALTPLIKETATLMRATLPANVAISERVAPGPDMVRADPTQIHQILVNLCTNAGHAMRETGGTLTIALSQMQHDTDTEQPEALAASTPEGGLPPGDYLRLTVSDTGPGISPKLARRIFDPFFTTKQPGEGTGMGLAVVDGIVNRLHGALELHSAPGEGAAFSVYLPAFDGEEEHGTHVVGTLPLGAGERILLVDDEPALAKISQDSLTTLGYNVLTLTSSREALDLLATDPNRFDLLITDQAMPEVTGVTLLAEAKLLAPALPTILVTGFSETPALKAAEDLGVTHILIKPVPRHTLAHAVRDALKWK